MYPRMKSGIERIAAVSQKIHALLHFGGEIIPPFEVE